MVKQVKQTPLTNTGLKHQVEHFFTPGPDIYASIARIARSTPEKVEDLLASGGTITTMFSRWSLVEVTI